VPRQRILVADDEPLIGAFIVRALADHEVVCVCGGAEVLARIAAGERYDVILCDVSMSPVGGEQVYRELTVAAPDQARRMAFATGGAFKPADQAFLDGVARPRLDKPFSIAELRAIVDGVLDGASASV
jgi:CheY-like chemotaxis protein